MFTRHVKVFGVNDMVWLCIVAVFVSSIASCSPSRDPFSLVDGSVIDGDISAEQAMHELDRNSVDPIMIYGESVVAYVSLNGETNRYLILATQNELNQFLKEAESKRVPIHVVESNAISRHTSVAILLLVGAVVAGIAFAMFKRKKGTPTGS